MTPESKAKAKIKKILNEVGAYYVMPHGAGFGNAGVPDFLICHMGEFIGVEAKATAKDTPTALQLHNLMEIRKAGGRGLVIHCDNTDELINLLKGTY